MRDGENCSILRVTMGRYYFFRVVQQLKRLSKTVFILISLWWNNLRTLIGLHRSSAFYCFIPENKKNMSWSWRLSPFTWKKKFEKFSFNVAPQRLFWLSIFWHNVRVKFLKGILTCHPICLQGLKKLYLIVDYLEHIVSAMPNSSHLNCTARGVFFVISDFGGWRRK